MPRRLILTERQRATLLDLPTDKQSLLKHYTLDDEDLGHICKRRRPENRLGFALQLCALRYPGRALYPGELISKEVLSFIGDQIGIAGEVLISYAVRRQTRQTHMDALRYIYGYHPFSGKSAHELKDWLEKQAEEARSNEDMARRFVMECRRAQTILPAISTIERLCADALVAAEQRIEKRITNRLNENIRSKLDSLLTNTVDDRLTRFIWLRQFEVESNSSGAIRLLERLEFLQGLELPPDILSDITPHRINRLRRQGERYFADGLRDISMDRRLAILAVCAVEWKAAIADALVETHDRIVGKTWREAKKTCEAKFDEAKLSVNQLLRSFADLGSALLEARNDKKSLEDAVSSCPGWPKLQSLVARASHLTDTLSTDPLSYVVKGHQRFKRYVPRMLRTLKIESAPIAAPLMKAANLMRDNQYNQDRPTNFLRKTSKWHKFLKPQVEDEGRMWEVAVMFCLRDAFRSGDIWLQNSRCYSDLKEVLVPAQVVVTNTKIAVPLRPEAWLADRRARMEVGLKRLAKAAQTGSIPNGTINNGVLQIERLTNSAITGVDELILDLYQRIPDIRITDLLMEVDEIIGFTDIFPHLRTGIPCKDKIGLLNVLLAEGINLGLHKMAEASNTHEYWELTRIARWHIESEAINQALAIVVEAQSRLPMAKFWGMGFTSSSDGQFFPTTRQGEAMNLINAKYGNEPGLKAYTHVSDQFSPFATQAIPAIVNEAPFILDGLLMNETGRRIREQYADTGGFTDHVFAVTALLGYQFIPRIRNLPSKRLYVFDPSSAPKELQGLIGGKIREDLIKQNWLDILRSAATMVDGVVPPSQLLRKFASYPRQHELAITLREIGRIERTLFIINWLLDIDMQRRAQAGLNKGESHHALKNALRVGRQGEICDRTTEAQHYRLAGLNLLAAIVIYWNSLHLGNAVTQRKRAGLPVPPELLAHTSPLGWSHILITGEYRWKKK